MRAKTVLSVLFLISLVVAAFVVLRALPGKPDSAPQVAANRDQILVAAIPLKPGDRDFLQVVLTPGARAIAIPVTTGGASTGLLYPGDRVDVVLTQQFNDAAMPLTRKSVG